MSFKMNPVENDLIASTENCKDGVTKLIDTSEYGMIEDTMVVKSMCMNCEKEGLNKIVKVNIPYFKNILIHAFECSYCEYKNNVVQDLNQIKEKGVKITFHLTKKHHFDRQLIKSEYGVLKIPEIDFEIPKETQKGSINTIEGFLQTALQSLTTYLGNLKIMYISEEDPATISNKIKEKEEMNCQMINGEEIEKRDINENVNKRNVEQTKEEQTKEESKQSQQMTIENYMKLIEKTIDKLSEYANEKKTPLLIEIIDPSGLSSLEHYEEDIKNNIVTLVHYERSKEELHELGFYEEDFTERKIEQSEKEKSSTNNGNKEAFKEKEIIKNDTLTSSDMTDFHFIKKYLNTSTENESITYKTMTVDDTQMIESFSSNCPCCNYLGSNNFCEISIPGFKKCLILSFVCNNCNYKTSEVKSSGEINKKGKTITLTVKSKKDLNRFIIKSETASVQIPKLELISDYGALGGLLTTVEGLLQKIVESLEDRFKFFLGDSSKDLNVSNVHMSDFLFSKEEKKKNEEEKINSVTGFNIEKIKELIENLNKLFKSEEMFPFDLIIDDIASNSFISSDDVGQKENLKEEEYDRTFEQNEFLGINSMKTEDY